MWESRKMKIKTVAGAVSMLFVAAAAQAETIRYEFDQAFWGVKPSTVEAGAWQAGREAAVAANPGDFRRMTGGFDFDTLYGLASDFALTVDFGPVSHTFTLNNPASDYFLTKTRSVDFQIFTFGFTIEDSFGPSLTYGDATDEQYKARLDLDFVYYKSSQELTTRATALLREFEPKSFPIYGLIDYGIFGIIGQTDTGAYDSAAQLGFDSFGQPAARDGGAQSGGGSAGGPAVSAVPLPASGLMLLAVAAFGALVGRRRAAA